MNTFVSLCQMPTTMDVTKFDLYLSQLSSLNTGFISYISIMFMCTQCKLKEIQKLLVYSIILAFQHFIINVMLFSIAYFWDNMFPSFSFWYDTNGVIEWHQFIFELENGLLFMILLLMKIKSRSIFQKISKILSEKFEFECIDNETLNSTFVCAQMIHITVVYTISKILAMLLSKIIQTFMNISFIFDTYANVTIPSIMLRSTLTYIIILRTLYAHFIKIRAKVTLSNHELSDTFLPEGFR